MGCQKIQQDVPAQGLDTSQAGTFHATGEASPVGEDHQREVLAVEVTNGLGGLKS